MSLFSTLNRVKHLFQKPTTVFIFKNSLENAHKTNQLQTRNISASALIRLFKKPTPAYYKIKDNIPVEFSMIYRNTMERYMLMAQLFSTVSACFVGLIILSTSYEGKFEITYESFDKKPKTMENELYIYVGALTMMCIILQLMVAKMPLRIYNYNKTKKYIFVFGGYMPYSTKRMVCKAGDIIKTPEHGILPWKQSRYEIKDTANIIMVENFFKTPADLHVMLGYQENVDDEEL